MSINRKILRRLGVDITIEEQSSMVFVCFRGQTYYETTSREDAEKKARQLFSNAMDEANRNTITAVLDKCRMETTYRRYLVLFGL